MVEFRFSGLPLPLLRSWFRNLSFYLLLYNKTKYMHQFHKFTIAWNSTCYGQFLCPSSGVYSLHTRQWYMSHRFLDSFRNWPSWSCSKAVYTLVWHIPLLSVQWIHPWWWAEELSETCRVSCQNKFVKLVHLAGFIVKKFVTMQGHMNVKSVAYVYCHVLCDFPLVVYQAYYTNLLRTT
jgi:hypothetical protein